MAAASAPHSPGFRGSIERSGESLKTGHDTWDWAVETIIAFYLSLFDWCDAKVSAVIDRDKTQAHNIVGAAVTLGLSVIMLILMAIVAGYFVAEAPSNGAFSEAIDQVESIGGTAFILLAVALLAVPVVAVVGYFMRSGLGGFITGGGMRR